MSNLRNFPNKSFHQDYDLDHEGQPENPDSEKLQRLLGEMIESTAGSLPRSSRDREVRIRNFRSDRFKLTEDLIVTIEDRGDQYIANSYDTGQYGLGSSPDSAIQDLCSVLEDYYDLLVEDRGRLSEHLRGHLLFLDGILREIE